MSAAPQANPGRPLAILSLLLVVLSVWAFWPGQTNTPRLGLDLQGGTQVILGVTVPEGQTVTDQQLATTVSIIRQRVDSFGVAEAEVTTQSTGAGPKIIVAIPGTTSQQVLDTLRTTAKLDFRPVQDAAAGIGVPPQPVPTVQPTGAPTATGTARPSPTGTPAPTATRPGPTVSPNVTPTAPAATTSPTGNGAALSSALAAAGSSPSPTATATRPEASPTGTAPAPSPTGTAGAPSPTGTAPAPSPTATAPPVIAPFLGDSQEAVQGAFDRLDCGAPGATPGGRIDDPTKWMATCSVDKTFKYLLQPAAVRGTDISDANTQLGNLGQWEVTLSFNSQGAADFLRVTTQLSTQQPPQNQFGIVLDGLVQSAPSVSEPIPGGQARITGSFTQQEAQNLANVLRFGALPLTLTVDSVESITPTLGSDQLRAGVIAGLLGLLLVVVYLLIYYRALGTVAVASLLVAALITYTLFVILGRTIGFTLTLAGVAGAIVAIGITADSFVVYFERIRDEIRDGKTLRQACDEGWVRSRRTILAADFVSLLAAVVLYFLSVGSVRGFAFTLGLTTIIDVLVAFIFTRPMVTLLAKNPWFSKGGPWTGLDPKRLGVDAIAVAGRKGTKTKRPAGESSGGSARTSGAAKPSGTTGSAKSGGGKQTPFAPAAGGAFDRGPNDSTDPEDLDDEATYEDDVADEPDQPDQPDDDPPPKPPKRRPNPGGEI